MANSTVDLIIDGLEKPYSLVCCGIHVGALCIIWLIAVFLNILTLIAFYRRKSPRSNNHRFLISLTVNNLIGILVVLPVSFLDIMESCFRIPEAGPICGYISVLFPYLTGVAVLNITLIGYDRFLACVRNPLFYGRNMNYRRSLVCIGASWVIPALFLLPAMFDDFPGGSLSSLRPSCVWTWSRNPTTQFTAVLISVGNFTIPFLALLAIYAKVFTAAKSNTSHSRKFIVYKFKDHLGTRTSINIGVNKLSSATQSLALSSRQNSTSSLQSFLLGQEKRKTLHVIILILLSFVLCYSPVYAEALVSAFWKTANQTIDPNFLHSSAQLCYFLGSIINPVVYVLCNSSLRQDIRRCFMRQAEIRRQSSLHLQGSFRSQYMWQSTSDKALTRHSICPDLHSRRKSFAASSHVNIPVITCTSPKLSRNQPEEDDIRSPTARFSIDNNILRSSLDLPDEEEPNSGNVSAISRRSSYRSRKSVSFAEDPECGSLNTASVQ